MQSTLQLRTSHNAYPVPMEPHTIGLSAFSVPAASAGASSGQQNIGMYEWVGATPCNLPGAQRLMQRRLEDVLEGIHEAHACGGRVVIISSNLGRLLLGLSLSGQA